MDLNEGQKAAGQYGFGVGRPAAPLLIIAGAGPGKTKTRAHRVARLVLNGTDPQRILLLTFTRRAAAEMTRRAARILGEARRTSHAIGTGVPAYDIGWSRTFHAIASRLLRLHAHCTIQRLEYEVAFAEPRKHASRPRAAAAPRRLERAESR